MVARLLTAISLLILAIGLAACGASGGGGPSSGRIEGTVIYLERMQLPPAARIRVQLEDIARPDALATQLEQVEMLAEQGPPYPFVIDYDDLATDRRGHYALRATISAGGQLLFTSTEYIDPFADGPLEIRVHRVSEQVPSP